MWVQQEEHKRVGELLALARDEANLKQAELARRLKKPQSFVSNYESGQRRIDVLEFLKICSAIGANPTSLFAKIAKLRAR